MRDSGFNVATSGLITPVHRISTQHARMTVAVSLLLLLAISRAQEIGEYTKYTRHQVLVTLRAIQL